MPKQVIRTDSLSAPIAQFSRGVRVGDTVLISATAGLDPQLRLPGSTPGRTDVEAQTEHMLRNVERALNLLGAEIPDVVRVKGYILDWRDRAIYDRVYASHFSHPLPVRATMGCTLFAMPQLMIEVQLEARIGCRKQAVESDRLPPAQGPFAQGGILAGGTFYTAQVPADRGGNVVGVGDPHAQTVQALQNLSVALNAAGLSSRDVVMVNAYVADVRHYAAFEEAYRSFFTAPYPARSIVFAKLAQPEWLVEVEAVAVAGSRPVYLVSTQDPQPSGFEIRASDRLHKGWGAQSHGVLAGDFLYVSGQHGIDARGRLAEGITVQTEQALRNVQAIGEMVGLRLKEDLVQSIVIFPDVRHYQGFNRGYGPFFEPPFPARAAAEGALVREGLLVQIEGLLSPLGRDATVLTAGG